ncbi:hypothetical protein KKD52_01690, partial [Myxococcota bacterium]|nr:hypothetical protein [Myxococcota bacterium]
SSSPRHPATTNPSKIVNNNIFCMLFLLRKKPLPMIGLRNSPGVKGREEKGKRDCGEDGEEGKKTKKRLRRRQRRETAEKTEGR